MHLHRPPLLGESLEPYHYSAAAIIIGGIVLAEWAAHRNRTTP